MSRKKSTPSNIGCNYGTDVRHYSNECIYIMLIYSQSESTWKSAPGLPPVGSERDVAAGGVHHHQAVGTARAPGLPPMGRAEKSDEAVGGVHRTTTKVWGTCSRTAPYGTCREARRGRRRCPPYHYQGVGNMLQDCPLWDVQRRQTWP